MHRVLRPASVAAAVLAGSLLLGSAGLLESATILGAEQVDPAWLRTWTLSQRHAPDVLDATSRIASTDEPGTPLVIDGRVVEPDGRTPAAGVVVFGYQTGDDGRYFAPGRSDGPWRLRGWARTDADGRFTFRTIRPGPYPGRDIPAHVHFTFETERFGRQWTRELRFADDPLVTADERRESAAAVPYGAVHEVRVVDGVARVRFATRLKPQGDF